ncbi:MAG: methyl-accepting chemotaxis protein [Phenylobacterium sp.]
MPAAAAKTYVETFENEAAHAETAFADAAVAKTFVAVMMVNRELEITYINESTRKLLGDNIELFQKTFPRMDFNNLVGVCIDGFHKNPQHQRSLLSVPRETPHVAEISVGDLRFSLRISSVIDAAGEYVGNVLEWEDVTAARQHEGMLAAIDKVQAEIEFSLTGEILGANENFLRALDYRLEDILGRHHSMFVDPSEAHSPEYRQFWEKLARGEYDSGEYKRIGRGGREVWIMASYNPILDRNGKPFKVVKFATDVTEQKLQTVNYEGQLAAINKSQAVIEFDLEGKVLTANPNFLAALGYSLDEIRGQHHSMFVDPAYRQSAEYQMFWAKLGRGEYDAGQYKRIGKGGKEIWIQASYNPILDLNGKPFKVVKYATDVSAQRKVAERVQEISGIVASAASEMRATAEAMARTAEQATTQAASVAAAAQLASTNVQTVAAAGEELSASISEIARQVTDSTTITQQAVAETDRTSTSIQTLAEAAQKIGNVVTLINNIAGQTKLLALNATIEAARAGDAGKGFAVVASEVKSLSDQTAKATHEISSQVSAMQAATATSVTAIQGIADTIRKVADIASAIASAVEEQSAATAEISSNVVEAATSTEEVSLNIRGVNEAVGQTSEASAELLNASGELAVQAEALSAEMETFLR